MSEQTPTADRFWAKVARAGRDDCWIWEAGTRSTGYGSFWNGERRVSAHRFAYELERGPIPPGMVLDHLCRVRLCVNPLHLEPVTNRENLLRGVNQVGRQARQTHCIHGHEFTPENTYIGPTKGDRQCRTCKRAWDKKRRAA